ncbi:hypothetical protein OIHEL45_19511, partial [Sulfitobacter indolifex HEL-45]
KYRNANYFSSLIYAEVAFVEKPYNLKVRKFICYQKRGPGVFPLGLLLGRAYDWRAGYRGTIELTMLDIGGHIPANR